MPCCIASATHARSEPCAVHEPIVSWFQMDGSLVCGQPPSKRQLVRLLDARREVVEMIAVVWQVALPAESVRHGFLHCLITHGFPSCLRNVTGQAEQYCFGSRGRQLRQPSFFAPSGKSGGFINR